MKSHSLGWYYRASVMVVFVSSVVCVAEWRVRYRHHVRESREARKVLDRVEQRLERIEGRLSSPGPAKDQPDTLGDC